MDAIQASLELPLSAMCMHCSVEVLLSSIQPALIRTLDGRINTVCFCPHCNRINF